MNSIQTEIIKEIKLASKIIIYRHQRPDPDAFGSQLGLKALITKKFPEKKVYAVGDNTPLLSKNFKEKMDEIPVEEYQNALIIIVDTADRPRIAGQNFNDGLKIIKIDHHPNIDQFGELQWVVPEASATSELLANLAIDNSNELPLNETAAKYFYMGIVGDTGRFMYATDSSTLTTTAKLLEYNIEPEKINREFNSITEAQLRFGGLVQKELKIEEQVAYIILSKSVIEEANLGVDGTEFITGIPGQVEDVKIWAIIQEQDKNLKYRVRIRSKEADISEVAQHHHGGGHPQASGAQAKDIQEVNQIILELKQLIKNGY